MATNGVSAETPAKTEPKAETDAGAGDAPERTPDHAKLLENKLTVEVANKLDDIFKTGLYLDTRASLVSSPSILSCVFRKTNNSRS